MEISMKDIWDRVKMYMTNWRQNGAEAIFKEIMANSFPKLTENIKL